MAAPPCNLIALKVFHVITSFCGGLMYIETLWNLWTEAWIDLVPHNGTQWKCLVLDTPSFYDQL